MGRLAGKAIVVTGGARGLGEAYARALVAEGASIILNDIDSEGAENLVALLSGGPGRILAHCGDVSSWSFASELVERCVSAFGTIDGLINNAGVFLVNSIEEQEETALRRQIEVNLIGQANCGFHALRHMRERNSGSVINTYSGAQAGAAYRSAYSAAMAGVAGLTYAWASECERTGVRVNAIAPIASTVGIQPGVSSLATVSAGNLHASVERLRQTTEEMTPEMIVPIVLYLLSDLSSSINGQGIRRTGDELMIMAHPGVWSPVLRSDEWTVEKIHEAFSTEWRDQLPTLGLAEHRSEFIRRLG